MRVFSLVLRFVGELIVLAAVGTLVFQTLDGPAGWIGGIGVPLAMAVVWGTFAVPGDPSRSGNAPVPVSGVVRLVIEFLFFAAGLLALGALSNVYLGIALGLGMMLEYLPPGDRFRWLLNQPSPPRR